MATERDQLGRLYSTYAASSCPNVDTNSNTSLISETGIGSIATKKKRRKLIKSCTFCRKRKLRCDQQKPMCSTCIARGLPDCIYLDEGLKQQVETTNSSETGPNNAKLLDKINDLEKQLKDVANKVNGSRDSVKTNVGDNPHSGVDSASSGPYIFLTSAVPNKNNNPFRNFYCLQSKENGRKILYGPTSIRTFFTRGGCDFAKRYSQLKHRVKMARNQIKKDLGISMLRENTLLEQSPDICGENGTDHNLMQQIASVLPTYEQIEKILDLFFAKPDLYQISEAFDKSKVIADFRLGFIPGITSESTDERPIIDILPHKKLNYYKVGVVVGIISLVQGDSLLPFVIEKFFVFLLGLSTGKMMYIERIQLTLLRYFYRDKWGQTGGDNTHMIALVDSMVCDAISLGLNHDIQNLVGGEPELIGSMESLEKLFCWVLYLDLTMAFNIGRPLKLNDDNIFQDGFFDDDSDGFYGLLKRFLKMARPIMNSIFDRNVCPDLNRHCDDILNFIKDQFLPISYYTDRNSIHKVPLQETGVLCSLLDIFLSLCGLQILSPSATKMFTKNAVFKVSLVSLSLTANLLAHCLELDEQAFPEAVLPECKVAPPYVSLGVSMTLTVLKRSVLMPYLLAYQKLIIFENTFLTIDNSDSEFDWDFSTLQIPHGKISAIRAMPLFRDMFDALNNPKDPRLQTFQKCCQSFTIMLSAERVFRTVIEKVMECRSITESSWKTQFCPNTDSPRKFFCSPPMINVENEDIGVLSNFEGNSRPKRPLISTQTTSTSKSLSTPADSNVNTLKNEIPLISPDTATLENVRMSDSSPSNQASDIFGLISDDFFESYNSTWTKLLNNVDSGQLFPDMNI